MKLRSLGCLAPILAITTAAGLVATIPGCGSGDDGIPTLVSQLITRLAGGSITNNLATLTVPANSLAADTTITLQTESSLPAPPAGKVIVSGTGYTFAPDGTTFSPNATLVIGYTASALPANVPASSLKICRVAGSGWTDLGGTVDANARTVAIGISQFSTYAILGTPESTSLNPKAFEGNWTGRWVNTTFGSQNDATLVISVNESNKTVTSTVRVFGNVLGSFFNPAAETFTGTYNDTQFTINANSTVFGATTLTINSAGQLTAHANTTSNATISSVDLTGTVNSSQINTNYTVHFRDGSTAVGTLTFTKGGT
jgi:hypothetical protein